MIPHNISSQIIVAGTSPEGKGGIATVISTQRDMMAEFNFVCMHRNGIGKLIEPFKAIFKSLRYIPRRYRLAHIHTASYIDFYRSALIMGLFRMMGKKTILHIHGAEFEKFYGANKKLVTSVCNKADAIVTVSGHYVDFIRRAGLGKNVFLLHNSIKPHKPFEKVQANGNHKFRLAFFGAIDSRKGIIETVEAIGRHQDIIGKDIELLIGGVGDTERLNAVIRKYSLEDTVRLLGWLDADGKRRLLSTADAFIHPSFFESFGIAILEAMDYGLPIITTCVGGIKDLVTDNVNGIIVEPGNTLQIAQAINTLKNNAELCRRYGEASSKHAADFYEPVIEQRLRSIYESLLSK